MALCIAAMSYTRIIDVVDRSKLQFSRLLSLKIHTKFDDIDVISQILFLSILFYTVLYLLVFPDWVRTLGQNSERWDVPKVICCRSRVGHLLVTNVCLDILLIFDVGCKQ